MRVEANISISADPKKFGTKVEVKNLNSFRAVERSIRYEIERHTALLEAGEAVVQETRGFDDSTGKTYSQRKKEDSHDYRYFPDPDIPKFYLSEMPELSTATLVKTLPELPSVKRQRYMKEYGLKTEDAEVFVGDSLLAGFFEGAIEGFSGDASAVQLCANYIISDLLGLMRSDKRESVEGVTAGEHRFLKIRPEDFASLIKMNRAGKLSSRGTKDILKVMFEEGGSPEAIAGTRGLIQESDSANLGEIVMKVMAENPSVVSDYRAGKGVALQYLLGQCMRATKGAGNPGVLKSLLEEGLKKS
jgi:aspartyl-tRNA(Asn)/glutamyl-tRNA(Gln) amidotransferase subunit B